MPVAMDEMTLLELVSEPLVILSESRWKSNSCQQTGRMEDVLVVALNDPHGSKGKWPMLRVAPGHGADLQGVNVGGFGYQSCLLSTEGWWEEESLQHQLEEVVGLKPVCVSHACPKPVRSG